jgi:hypothetical protein
MTPMKCSSLETTQDAYRQIVDRWSIEHPTKAGLVAYAIDAIAPRGLTRLTFILPSHSSAAAQPRRLSVVHTGKNGQRAANSVSREHIPHQGICRR